MITTIRSRRYGLTQTPYNIILSALFKATHEFESNNVPGKYWQEQIKWILKNDLQEWGTVDEKLRLIEDTVREITARYVEETTT